MNTRELIHLHDYQKRAIIVNLKRFKSFFKSKLYEERNKAVHPGKSAVKKLGLV